MCPSWGEECGDAEFHPV